VICYGLVISCACLSNVQDDLNVVNSACDVHVQEI
jgi:hypothetical protein